MNVEKCGVADCANNSVIRTGIERPHSIEVVHLCKKHWLAYLALPAYCETRSALDRAEGQTQ